VDADDVVGPIDCAQEADELVLLAVRQDVVRDREVGGGRIDHVDEATLTAELGTVCRLVDDARASDRLHSDGVGDVGGLVSQLGIVAVQQVVTSEARAQ